MASPYPDPAAAAAAAPAPAPAAERPVRVEDAWEFYRSIGSPKHIMAPMVDQSDQPFRLLGRKYGVDVCYTPMFHARLFAENAGYRKKNWTSQLGARDRDAPLFVQFCANKPEHLLAAARLVQDDCEAVDINFGCPQGIARKGNYGAYLLSDVPLMVSLVRVLHQNLKIPVTAKIRVLPTVEETLHVARSMQEAGAAILTVHGRTKEQNKHLVGPNNFELVARIKQELSIPVFANGGIETLDDVRHALEVTKCDGVMSSEGLLCNPALFSGTRPSGVDMAREYLELAAKYPPPRSCLRPHLFKLLHRELSVHTHLRGVLGRASTEEMHDVMRQIVEADEALGEEGRKAAYEGKVYWYRRHQTYKKQRAPEDPTKRKLFEALYGSTKPAPGAADQAATGTAPADAAEQKVDEGDAKRQRVATASE